MFGSWIEALKRPADQPECSLRILDDCRHWLRRWPARPSLPRTEAAGNWVFKAVEAIVRTSPEGTLTVNHQGVNEIVTQAMRIGGVVPKRSKRAGPWIVPV